VDRLGAHGDHRGERQDLGEALAGGRQLAIGFSPAARSLGWRKSLRLLWATALDTIPQ
jgi:hypothetical protein